MRIGGVAGLLAPGRQASARLREIAGVLAFVAATRGPLWRAELDLPAPVSSGLRPAGYPIVLRQGRLRDAAAVAVADRHHRHPRPPPTAAGAAPDGAAGRGVVIDLHGSYGGARESLWTARDRAAVPREGRCRCARRSSRSQDRRRAAALGAVAGARQHRRRLRPHLLGDAVRFGGDLAVTGLSLQHDGLSTSRSRGVAGLVLGGSAYPERRRVELEMLEGRLRHLVARITGSVELPRGTYTSTTAATCAWCRRSIWRWPCPTVVRKLLPASRRR